MKVKLPLLVLSCIMLLTSSCKKDKNDSTITPNQTSLDSETRQFNDDSNFYKGESDQSNNDVNTSLSEISAFGKVVGPKAVFTSPLCGVTIDSSQIANKILFFNFDGVTPCFSPSRTRSGQIKVQLIQGNYWRDSGAVLKMDYINFSVVRLYDNKSVTINGSKTLENVNGNDWLGFYLGNAQLKYRERALGIQATFSSGSTAIWNSVRISEWNYSPADTKITFSAQGDTALNGFTNVDSWGVNRFGYNFTTNYTAPLVSNSYCGFWRFTSGELVHHVNNANYTLTLGVDQSGNPSTLACAYGYKVSWIPSGSTTPLSLVFSY